MTAKFPVSIKDNILQGITFEDLITAVHCNEDKTNKEELKSKVIKTYESMFKSQIEESIWILKNNLDFIMKELDS